MGAFRWNVDALVAFRVVVWCCSSGIVRIVLEMLNDETFGFTRVSLSAQSYEPKISYFHDVSILSDF